MEGLKSLFSLKIYNTFLNPDVVNFIEKNGYRFLGSASAFSNGKMIDCNQLRKGTHRYDFFGGGLTTVKGNSKYKISCAQSLPTTIVTKHEILYFPITNIISL